jgi:hypothetical protein
LHGKELAPLSPPTYTAGKIERQGSFTVSLLASEKPGNSFCFTIIHSKARRRKIGESPKT